MSPPLTIDVVSDVVCPWCYLGKARLAAALAATAAVPVTIRWRPFQLDPGIPSGGLSREDYIARKFGDRHQFEAAEARLAAIGIAEGVIYRFDRIRRTPNTIDAHRLVRWASEIGKEAETVDRLFRLYFAEGADIGRPEILAGVAADMGLDRDRTVGRLASDEDRATVMADIAIAQRMGITGVPCFILGGRTGVMGAQTAAVLAEAIRKTARQSGILDGGT